MTNDQIAMLIGFPVVLIVGLVIGWVQPPPPSIPCVAVGDRVRFVDGEAFRDGVVERRLGEHFFVVRHIDTCSACGHELPRKKCPECGNELSAGSGATGRDTA